MSEYVPIKTETLKSFADEARRISGTVGELSTAEMLNVFENAASLGNTYYPVASNLRGAYSYGGYLLCGEGVFVTGSQGITIYNRNDLSYYLIRWGLFNNWEIGMRFKPAESSKSTRVLCGCAHSGSYYRAPTIELYSGGTIGIGYSNASDKWTKWYNDNKKHVDYDVWNFLRYSYDSESKLVTITIDSESGRHDVITFAEQPFYVYNSTYDKFAFGQIAQNSNYATDVLFDTNNLYIKADGSLLFGRYELNTDPTLTGDA